MRKSHNINRSIRVFIILLLSTAIISLSCQDNSNNPVTNYSKPTYRDSLYFAYTLKEWTRLNIEGYGAEVLVYFIPVDKIIYETFDAYYSPDSLRIVVFVSKFSPIIKKWENKSWTEKDMDYNLNSMIGFRDSTNQPWVVYPLDISMLTDFPNKEEALALYRHKYFNKLSEFMYNVNVVDTNYGKPYIDKVPIDIKKLLSDNPDPVKCYERTIGFNLGDSLFWTRSLLWQKGSRLPGLYVFQVKNCVRSDEGELWGGKPWDSRVKTPNINYPDSIVQMYK
ncbi:MAG: hypothetical protein IPM69_04585 [Ignavibacteria bacterium]|nr:hypothetical protein [Ignavibacteria bacterium]